MLRSDYAEDGPIGAHLQVHKQPDGSYKAVAEGLKVEKVGRSENEAINLVKQEIQKLAAEGKI